MGKRSKATQSKHDRKVLKEANALKRDGFKVKADLKGWEKPTTINSKRPDVTAKKGKQEKIIEVETPMTKKTDLKQHEVFQKYSDRGKNRDFKIKIAK